MVAVAEAGLVAIGTLVRQASGYFVAVLLLLNHGGASLAGFFFPGKWNQSPGELRSLICCPRLPTYTWNRRASLLR